MALRSQDGSVACHDRVGDILGGEPDTEGFCCAGFDLVSHRGLHVERPHGDHPDAVAVPFDVERLGDAAHEEFGRAVIGELGLAVDRRRGGQVDDDGVGCLAQVRKRGVQTVDDALGVDVDLLEVRAGLEVLEAAGEQDARVVDHHVEPVAGGLGEFAHPLRPFRRCR